jgi:hypothetical protein
MSNNIVVATLKYIAVEIIWDIIYFPLWWYTKGAGRVARYCYVSAENQIKRRLALGIWLANMFRPMYGDYTIEGRIISGFMRLFVLIWKLFLLFLWLVVLAVLFVAWLVVPLLFVYYILYQVFNVPFFFFKQ